MLFSEYIDGDISIKDFIKFLSDEYYVDVVDGEVELLSFNNMQLVDIRNDGKFKVGKDNDLWNRIITDETGRHISKKDIFNKRWD